MKHLKTALTAGIALCAGLLASAHSTSVNWSTLGNDSDADGNYYIQRFTVKGNTGIKRLAFNQFARKMKPLDSADKLVEIVPGYYYIESPRFVAGADSVVVDIRVAGTLANRCYAPDGVHTVDAAGRTEGVDYTRASITSRPEQWSRPGRDRMPYGDSVYAVNERLGRGSYAPGVYDIVPSFKKVSLTGGESTLDGTYTFMPVENDNKEYFRLVVRDNHAVIEGDPGRESAIVARLASHGLLGTPEEPATLPDAVIEDWPDVPYRGVMIDIARNFIPATDLKDIVDLMAAYGLNVLHLHAVDDEAWRLDIPGLPELTSYGSRRGYTTDENDFLAQIFTGDGNPDNPDGSSNGHYTRAELIDLLRHAASRGVAVLPEIESPGHARAAIKAMEHRYRTTGDDTYRMTEPGDTSRYTSAQSFHDNVMNPALPGTYRFMEKIIDEIKALYAEAGVPLPGIHIGGDEVPRGAWDGSAVARRTMEAEGLATQEELHARYVRRVAAILAERGIPMYGWQDIAVGHSDDYNDAIRPTVGAVNCWTQSTPGKESPTAKALKGGYPVIVSNVDRFYLDMTYSDHPEELGLNWGGTVDEFKALNGYPAVLAPTDSTTAGLVKGLSGQLFAETVRSAHSLQSYLLPKMLGLAERAWNNDSTYTDAQFNAVIAEREMPMWEREGYNYHLRQPGIKLDGKGCVVMNSPYPAAEIRYTTDGSEPRATSALYLGPVPAEGIGEVRAAIFLNGKRSLTSLLYPGKSR